MPGNALYTSKESQNDLLESAADVVTGHIIREVKEAGMYAVIEDKARDTNHSEQMSVCLRNCATSNVQEI